MHDQPKDQLQVLNRFAHDLMGLSSAEDLIWYVVEEVVGQQDFVDCVIYLYDERRRVLVQEAAFGAKKGAPKSVRNAIEIPLGNGITGNVAISKKPEIVTDTRLDSRYVEDLRHMRSELTVPILHENRLFGVIDCEHPDVGYFTQTHLDFLSTVSSMLAVRLAQWSTLAQLVESEEKYRALFELSDDAMMLLTENRFELVNPAAARTFKYASTREMEQVHPSAVSPEFQLCGTPSFTKAEEMMRIAVEKGYNRFEWIHQKKTGETFPVEVTLTRVPYRGQVALYAICRDISEAKADQAALRAALSEAEAANMAKSSFLANMSHELRTPLNAIIGMSEMMTARIFGEMGAPKYEEYAEDIFRSGTFLLNMINDILDLSAIDANEHAMDKHHLDIADIIADCLVMVRPQARKKNITIDTDLSASSGTIWADGRSLRQVLINLLSNAIKFGHDKGKVTISAADKPDSTIISVTDDGCGIPQERLTTVTRRFDRGQIDPTKAIEGTGLGLAIVEKIVELHGGTLKINSEVGKGTTVWIELPKEHSD